MSRRILSGSFFVVSFVAYFKTQGCIHCAVRSCHSWGEIRSLGENQSTGRKQTGFLLLLSFSVPE